jgi:hypothetical protein
MKMKVLFLGALAICLSFHAQALELTFKSQLSEADANYCGDINSIRTYSITQLSGNDISPGHGANVFSLNSQARQAIEAVLKVFPSSEAALILTGQYDKAVTLMAADLALRRQGKKHHLASCYSLDVIPMLGLKIANRRLENGDVPVHNYFTFSELEPNSSTTGLDYHVVVDLGRRLVHVFVID